MSGRRAPVLGLIREAPKLAPGRTGAAAARPFPARGRETPRARLCRRCRGWGLGLAAALWLGGCVAVPQAAEAPWSRGAPMPTARSEVAVTAQGGRVLVAGGIGRTGTTAAFEAFEPATDRWRQLAPLPTALHHAAMAAVGGAVYLSGGYDDIFFTAERKETWAYDAARDRWRAVADMPAPRAAHRMVAIAGKLYVVGGVGPEASALWVYDPAADAWDASPAPLPTAREHLAATALDGRLHVIGGRWRGQGNLAVVEAYDPATDTWTRLPDLPAARGGHTAAAVAGRIHVTGGEAFAPARTFGEHWAFDPARRRWTALPDLPTRRHGLGSAALSGRWYVVGGGTGAGARTIVTLTDVIEVFAP